MGGHFAFRLKVNTMMSHAVYDKIINETEISDDYFLRLHFCVEAMLKRVLLIGLRLNGVQYRMAQIIAEIYHDPLHTYIDKAFGLWQITQTEMETFGNYKQLKDLFLKFTSYYRNKRVHGLAKAYTDTELLELCINIDKSFIKEIEKFLVKKYKLSLFDTPSAWGAKRGIKKDSGAVYKELLNKNKFPSKPEYTKEKVREILKGL
jgi:hypothetical protein